MQQIVKQPLSRLYLELNHTHLDIKPVHQVIPMEQQSIRMKTELERQYGKEDWSMTFRAGPDAIGILAECILITSRPKVMGIEIKGPGLE